MKRGEGEDEERANKDDDELPSTAPGDIFI